MASMPSLLRHPQLWLRSLLILLLLFGLGCRFHGLNWDAGAGLHPDERFCTGIVPRLHWPSSVGEWFDSSKSPLNPANLHDDKGKPDTHYVYGQLPLMIAKTVIGDQGDIAKLLPLLRGLSAFFDCLTVVFCLLIGRRLLGPTGGLFAGALVSLAALNIQQSHYFTTDTFAATFMTLAFWSGTRWVDTRKWFDGLGLGFWFGCALACKLSSAFFAVAWFGFVALSWRRYDFKKMAPLATCSFLLSFWAFRCFHPMMFMGAHGGFWDIRPDPRFLERSGGVWVGDFGQQLAITSGEVDVPFNAQWIGRKPWLFSLSNLGWWGFGWPLLLMGIAGGLWALRRPRRAPVLFVAAMFALVSFGVQGAQFSKFTRYFLPLTPMFALLAAFFWRELLAFKPRLRPLAGMALAYSFLWCVAVAAIYGRRHPRLEASQWIVDNVPYGARVATETSWDEGLPISWVPPGDRNMGFKEQKLESYDIEDAKKRVHLEEVLSNTDWLFVSSGRSWQNIPRWPQKWPMMTEFYRALFSGELGFDKVQEFTNYPRIGPLSFRDDQLEEALSVYEHPRVLIFRKRSDFSLQDVERILNSVALPTTDQFHPREAPGQWEFLPQPQ